MGEDIAEDEMLQQDHDFRHSELRGLRAEIDRLKAALVRAEGAVQALERYAVLHDGRYWRILTATDKDGGYYDTREQAVAAFRKAAGLGEGE